MSADTYFACSVSSISNLGARLRRGGGEWSRLKKRDEAAEHWTRLRKCARCRVKEDRVNEDKVKLWTRLRRSSAGDEEDVEDKTKLWTRLKRSGHTGTEETGWVRMM